MNDTPLWRLDECYKFQLAFFCEEDEDLLQSVEVVSVPPYNSAPANKPDIDNLVLFKFLNRGFLPTVKAQSKNQKFYLKLFNFPKEISSETSSETILKNKFFLNEMPQGQRLLEYTAQPQNVFVKFGWIDLDSNDFASRPFPKFLIPKDPETAQKHFDRFLPFSSLYVSPPEKDTQPILSEEQLIEHSRKGVWAFQQELFDTYRSSKFVEIIKTGDHSRMFVHPKNSDKISVIWVKQIEFFKDIRERPMPLNRDRDFLSSLLLVHYTDFIPEKDGLEIPKTKEDLDRDWRPNLDSHHILEIASVVRL